MKKDIFFEMEDIGHVIRGFPPFRKTRDDLKIIAKLNKGAEEEVMGYPHPRRIRCISRIKAFWLGLKANDQIPLPILRLRFAESRQEH